MESPTQRDFGIAYSEKKNAIGGVSLCRKPVGRLNET